VYIRGESNEPECEEGGVFTTSDGEDAVKGGEIDGERACLQAQDRCILGVVSCGEVSDHEMPHIKGLRGGQIRQGGATAFCAWFASITSPPWHGNGTGKPTTKPQHLQTAKSRDAFAHRRLTPTAISHQHRQFGRIRETEYGSTLTASGYHKKVDGMEMVSTDGD
jgi:hypothetical protein